MDNKSAVAVLFSSDSTPQYEKDILVLSISLDTFYSNKNYAARKI